MKLRKLEFGVNGALTIVECYQCKTTMPVMSAFTDGTHIFCGSCAEMLESDDNG